MTTHTAELDDAVGRVSVLLVLATLVVLVFPDFIVEYFEAVVAVAAAVSVLRLGPYLLDRRLQ